MRGGELDGHRRLAALVEAAQGLAGTCVMLAVATLQLLPVRLVEGHALWLHVLAGHVLFVPAVYWSFWRSRGASVRWILARLRRYWPEVTGHVFWIAMILGPLAYGYAGTAGQPAARVAESLVRASLVLAVWCVAPIIRWEVKE